MRAVTRKCLRILSGESAEGWDPVMMMDILPVACAASSTIRICSSGNEISWDGNTYTPMPITRGVCEEILSTEAGEVPSISISLSNVDKQMATLLNDFELDDAEVTLHVCDRTLLTNARDAILLTTGRLRNLKLSAATFVAQIVPIIGQMQQIVLPRRVWEQHCTVRFGGRSCLGADPTFDPHASPFTIASTVNNGSTERILRVPAGVIAEAGNPTDPNAFWINADILFTSGALTAQARPFRRYDLSGGVHRLYVSRPFLKPPTSGDDFRIIRGCPKTKEGCFERQGNVLNFAGYSEVPVGNVKVSRVKAPT
jgi:hypothetical protein